MSDNPIMARKMAADIANLLERFDKGRYDWQVEVNTLRARVEGKWRCAVPCGTCGGKGYKFYPKSQYQFWCEDCSRIGWIVLED